MKTLSRNEWIAVAVGIIAVGGFALYIIISPSNSLTDQSTQTDNNLQTNMTDSSNGDQTVVATSSETSSGTEASSTISSAPSDQRVVKSGDTIEVQYTGKLQDGTVFDSSIPRGQPFSFIVGAGQVIKGWDEGFIGMKVGEKKTLTIAPEKAYGAQGITSGGKVIIPPNATLIFDVQLVGIK